MQRLEVSGAVRPIYVSLGVKRLTTKDIILFSAKCFNVTNKKENQVNHIWKPEKREALEL